MSNASNNNLSREKIQQLLIAASPDLMAAENTTGTKATEYNWHQPHYFDRNQLNKLDDFIKKVGKTIARKFSTLCQGDFNVTFASTTQHFAAELLNQALESKQNDYYLAFSTNQGHPCGLISIPTKTAFIWATQLLGDTESQEDSRVDLSQLEESLLLDIASAIVEALADADSNCDFRPARNIVRRLLPLELQGTEELSKITFHVKKTLPENSSEAYILMLCSKLEAVVGRTAEAVGGFSAEDISKAILGHIQQMPVSVTAQLASTMLTLEEIMSLEVNDILLLDKRIDEPVELIVNGRTAFRGRPAKSAGKHAVVITERSCDTE